MFLLVVSMTCRALLPDHLPLTALLIVRQLPDTCPTDPRRTASARGSVGQYVNAPKRFNGASTALPRRSSSLLGRAGDPISCPLRLVDTPLKQNVHGRVRPESSASEQSAQAHGVTSAAVKRAAKKTSGKTMRRASRPEVFKRF